MSAYDAGRGMVIPAHMMERLLAYIEHGVPTGDFLRAVLCNDLREACGRADDCNARILPAYVIYLFNNAPAPCWGSEKKVDTWLEKFAKARSTT